MRCPFGTKMNENTPAMGWTEKGPKKGLKNNL